MSTCDITCTLEGTQYVDMYVSLHINICMQYCNRSACAHDEVGRVGGRAFAANEGIRGIYNIIYHTPILAIIDAVRNRLVPFFSGILVLKSWGT
jgi:hypothetical protein